MTEMLTLDQPWDVLADYGAKLGWTIDEARDRVILAWLQDGNTDPYCDWVGRGHSPSHRVALLVARMMQKAKAPEAAELSDLSCGLDVSGDRRMIPDKEAEARKFLAARHSMILIEHGRRSGRHSIVDRSDAEAAMFASEIPLANNATIGASTVRQTRMALQRGMKSGTMPNVLAGLIQFD